MIDNETIKALEEHYKQVDKGYSAYLESGGKGDEHEEKYIYMLRDTLDLINRQKAEIEISKTKLFEQQLKKELHRLTVEEIKAEAIKDFAERLKKRLDRKYKIYGREYVLRHLRELVKEMLGEQ